VVRQSWQASVVSTHVSLEGGSALQAEIVLGVWLLKTMSNSGAPPVKAIPVATTVVAWPTTQHGPSAAEPMIPPSMHVPGDVQWLLLPHGRLPSLEQCLV
jgi:hypothetical protein